MIWCLGPVLVDAVLVQSEVFFDKERNPLFVCKEPNWFKVGKEAILRSAGDWGHGWNSVKDSLILDVVYARVARYAERGILDSRRVDRERRFQELTDRWSQQETRRHVFFLFRALV